MTKFAYVSHREFQSLVIEAGGVSTELHCEIREAVTETKITDLVMKHSVDLLDITRDPWLQTIYEATEQLHSQLNRIADDALHALYAARDLKEKTPDFVDVNAQRDHLLRALILQAGGTVCLDWEAWKRTQASVLTYERGHHDKWLVFRTESTYEGVVIDNPLGATLGVSEHGGEPFVPDLKKFINTTDGVPFSAADIDAGFQAVKDLCAADGIPTDLLVNHPDDTPGWTFTSDAYSMQWAENHPVDSGEQDEATEIEACTWGEWKRDCQTELERQKADRAALAGEEGAR